MTLHKLIVAACAALALVVTCVGLAVAQPALPTDAAPGMSSQVNLTAVLGPLVHWLLLIGGCVGAVFINSHVEDKDARSVLDRALLNGISLGFNLVNGALAGNALTVDLGSKVAAKALAYVLEVASEEAGRFGLDAPALAKRIVARIPGMDGEIPPDLFAQIAKAATGDAPPVPATSEILELLGPVLAKAISDHFKTTKSGATSAGTPVAAAA